MVLSERTYHQVALEDPKGRWELHRGRLREKPPMSIGHGRLISRLHYLLQPQLDWDAYEIRQNHGRLRREEQTTYIPALVVIPAALSRALLEDPHALDLYTEPLPLVVEVWSPSTGGYDVDAKIPEYQRRGDAEIWRLHPFERTLMAWRRRPDGSYEAATHREGVLRAAALPGVEVDLKALFGG
jgi:Uma2 family endonuclease